jgi:uncharacterized protein YhjY with autotransporter beta-barrel domain
MNRMIRPGAEWSLRINTAIGRKHVSTHSRSCARIVQLALSVGLYASLAAPTHAQVAAAPFELPFTVILTDATPLQQTMFNAVARMCVGALDFNPNLNAQQQDLHDQCHAIAGSAVMSPAKGPSAGAIVSVAAPASALGALQQVSGNQITSQGSLATRVSAGQFANISGRINALRFGSSAAITQGGVASNIGPQTFYLDGSMLDRSSQARASSPDAATAFIPAASGSFISTSYVDDKSMRVVSDQSSGSSGGALYPGVQVSNPWGLFMQGSYNSGRHDATAAEDPFNFHSASVTGGLDYNFGQAVLGASVGYDDYDASFRSDGLNVSGGSARVQGTSASLYAAWFGQNWNFNGIASLGRLVTNLTRQVSYTVSYQTAFFDNQNSGGFIPFSTDGCSGSQPNCSATVNRTLQSDPSGRSLAVGATGGYQYSAYSWNFDPSLSLAYRRATIDAFSESDPTDPNDGLPLAFGNQNVNSLRSVIGLDISRPVSVPFGVLTPLIRAEWDHEFETGERTIDAHYRFDPTAATTCLSCYQLPTDRIPANYGVVGAGLSVTLAHRLQAFVYDEVLVGYTDYHSNTVSVGLRGQL